MEQKVIYYSDELHDEFSPGGITPKVIDGSYVYLHNSLWKRFTHFFWYRIIATPLAWVYLKCRFSHKIIGRKALKAHKGGCFLFGNHTQPVADAFIPTMLAFPKTVNVIVHPDNVSMPVLGKITPSLGALPLPDDLTASKNFIHALETLVTQGRTIGVYPEAHIWPYYTGIRPFPDKSFRYPIKYHVPAFCFTNTYQKKGKRVQIVTYVDGPFYADPALPVQQQRQQLHDQVLQTMRERAKNSNVEVIRYVKKEETP